MVHIMNREGGEIMTAKIQQFEPFFSITTSIDQESIGDGLLATSLTGFFDVRQQLEVGGRRFLIEKILPFSYISVVEELTDGVNTADSKESTEN